MAIVTLDSLPSLRCSSTNPPSLQEEIQRVEDFYREYYGAGLPAPFPLHYPTGAIVGMVHVEDVLDQEAYDEQVTWTSTRA